MHRFLLLAWAAAAMPPAANLEEWIGALELAVPDGFDQTVGGVRVKIDKMLCDRMRLDSIVARAAAARTEQNSRRRRRGGGAATPRARTRPEDIRFA